MRHGSLINDEVKWSACVPRPLPCRRPSIRGRALEPSRFNRERTTIELVEVNAWRARLAHLPCAPKRQKGNGEHGRFSNCLSDASLSAPRSVVAASSAATPQRSKTVRFDNISEIATLLEALSQAHGGTMTRDTRHRSPLAGSGDAALRFRLAGASPRQRRGRSIGEHALARSWSKGSGETKLALTGA